MLNSTVNFGPDLSQCLLNSIAEHELLAVIDPCSQRVRSLNDALATCAGREAASCLDEPLENLFELSAADKAALAETASTGVSCLRKLLIRRPDGTRRRLASRLLAITDGTGASTGVLLQARDISDDDLARQELQDKCIAIDLTLAVIEFDLQGRVLHANASFLALMGFRLPEIQGQHHRMFCDPAYAASDEYAALWQRLRAGESASGEFKRLGKGGEAVWIRAAYNPILDLEGQPYKVVKHALDVTAAKRVAADHAGKMRAIDRAQAVIEFALDGTVLAANLNFLTLMGYTEGEVVGKHHRMFCEAAYADNPEYGLFWKRLGAGEFDAGEYKRLGKGGKEVWINATYNPILDSEGRPLKVVKFATDVTLASRQSANSEGKVQALGRSHSVVEFDLHGHVLNANPAFLDLMGYGLDEVQGRHHRMFVDEATAGSAAYRAFWNKLGRGDHDSGEYRRVGNGGKVVWLSATYNPILDFEGKPYKIVKYGLDVTQAKLDYAEFEGKVRAVNRAQAVIEFSLDGQILSANDNFLELMGYTAGEIVGKHHRCFVDPRYAASEAYVEFWRQLARGEFDAGEYRRIGKGGKEVWIQATYNPIFDLDGRPIKVVKFATDVTDRRRAQVRTQHLAAHDVLTGLPNRVMFNELLAQAVQSAARGNWKVAVLFIDLDRFKIVNDTLGHSAGDALLKEIARRLAGCLRTGDIVARLGGDEFVVLLQQVDGEHDATTVASKILVAVALPVAVQDRDCWVTASVGVSLYGVDARDEKSLMQNADVAMYVAKQNGKNGFQVYSQEIARQSSRRLAMEERLRGALERNEFFVEYQPKVDLKSGTIVGAEALLRWRDEELGLVPPSQFIPLTEETGQILSIGKWVLQVACAQGVTWQRQGLPPLTVAVNLSTRQFSDEFLLGDVAVTLHETGLQPDLLELEVTECMLTKNVDRALKLLTAIKGMGVRLAIDDFGTGYSSLGQLKVLPIDTLKIDHSFIGNLPSNAEDKAIVEAIIAMARALGLTVVAEGVETREQADFLGERDCDQMQGYYFGRPIGANEFAAMWRRHEEARSVRLQAQIA